VHATDPEAAPARDWRDTVSAASDLALLGIVTTLAALPVVTAGAVLGTASAAVHEWCSAERMPDPGTNLRRLRQGLLPGIGVVLATVAAVVLLGLDLAAVRSGVAPGGLPLLITTFTVILAGAGYAGLTVVEVGRSDGLGWLAAARRAYRTSVARPFVPLTLGGLVAVAGLLVLVFPPCLPLVVGYTLFGLHVVTGRLASRHPTTASAPR
jgi:hypothetical protein